MSIQTPAIRLILASGSRARRHMLEKAGLKFSVMPADIDERTAETLYLAGQGKNEGVALHLAREKARSVSEALPGAVVIGADQTLVFDGEILAKALSQEAARKRLERMAGKPHQLISGVALARDGQILWAQSEAATLHMREYSGAFLDKYCAHAGPFLTESVAGYALEEFGIHLFERIEGDYFTILGMPLLPLLGALRAQGVLEA